MTVDYEFAGIKIPAETKRRVKEIAKDQRRSLGSQALIFIELGLKEYERELDIKSGRTQIDMGMLRKGAEA